jgi:sec-independent protein translocase protein TatA
MGRGLLQPMHLLVILAIAVLVFGPKRLPGIGKGLGEAIRGFKDSFKGGENPQGGASKPKTLADTKDPSVPPAGSKD